MPNNCHECMKELSINTNINLYLFLFFIWYFRKTLGSPMVVMSVWKSFVATNPDALRYFTIYNWKRWNRNCNGCTCNCKVCPAILYNYLHWQRPGPAFTAGLYNYSCSAIDCNAMAKHTFHNSTFKLFRISNTHARLQACKVHNVCNMHSTLYSECMCMVHTGSATWHQIQSNFANRLTDDNGFLIGKVRMRSYNDNSHFSHN